jgi:hypothetical protein
VQSVPVGSVLGADSAALSSSSEDGFVGVTSTGAHVWGATRSGFWLLEGTRNVRCGAMRVLVAGSGLFGMTRDFLRRRRIGGVFESVARAPGCQKCATYRPASVMPKNHR